MDQFVKEIFTKITAEHSEDSVHEEVQEAKGEYVSDWEDDFEDIDEAYEEQGRGEAETQVLDGMIKLHFGEALKTEDYCTLFDALKEHYHLDTGY